MFHLNIRSFSKNGSDLQSYLSSISTEFHILALSETWTNCFNEENLKFQGYMSIVKSGKEKTIGSGVALMIKDHLKYEFINIPTDMKFVSFVFETICIAVSGRDIIVVVVYREHGHKLNTFLTEFDMFLLFLNKQRKPCYICGDFNINLLNCNSHPPTQAFLDLLLSFSFRPLINMPTRITENTSTLIDNIFANELLLDHFSGILYTDISDHLPVFTMLSQNVSVQKEKVTFKYKRKFLDSDKIKFENDILNESWQFILDEIDPNLAYNAFANKIKFLYDKYFPKVKFKIKQQLYRAKPWITKSLLISCKRKNKLYKKWLRQKTDSAINKYKTYKNKLNHLLRIAERKYYCEKFESVKSDLGKTWRIIKKVINKNNNPELRTEFRINNNMSSDGKVIVDAFNKFFVNVGPNLAKKISVPNNINHSSYFNFVNNKSMFFIPTDENEIATIISNIKPKSSSGHDELSSDILISSMQGLLKPLAHIINCSISTGVVPSEMKIAKITPVFKADDKYELNNYRPISVLPYFTKICEKVVFNRTMDFLVKCNILYEKQFGFRQKHSTFMALMETVDQISEAIEKKKVTIGVFIDLSKAYDTVDHRILLNKLEKYGLRGTVLRWFQSYLNDRKQYVSINNTVSNQMAVTCGVPQGSVLGPLLFLLYINDMVNCSTLLKFILFADDTNIFYSDSSLDGVFKIVNSELENLAVWFKVNKLSLNISKNNFILFNKQKNDKTSTLKLQIENNEITQVQSSKFLGVIIDKKLNWLEHIALVANKVSKSLGVLNKIKNTLPLSILPMLYNTLILPYFQYCNIIWANTYPSHLDKLIKLQKRGMRIISAASYRAHTTELFKKHRQLILYDINKLQIAAFMFMFHNKSLPAIFNSYFKMNIEVHSHNTRQALTLHIDYYRTNTRAFTIKVQGPKLWNSLDILIRNSKTLPLFKRHLKEQLLLKY
jgi:hypothetical protein